MQNNEYLNLINKDDCCGCGACYNKCPVGAISMRYDEEGFLTPYVDKSICINCGLCKKSCPYINVKYTNQKIPKCYAVMANDEIRAKSSSGGMFSVLSKYILDNGGVVCGAAYNENWEVHHILIDNYDDLGKLRKSKYVQSNIGDSYKNIKTILDKNKLVLFSGCPCQVAGLYSFLGKDYDNLITVDLVCHGVPAPKIFEEFLSTLSEKEDILSIDFREKDIFGWATGLTIKFRNKDTYRKRFKKCNYFRGFQYNLFLKKHCAVCKYSKIPRQADITLGDFWGIKKFDKNLHSRKGTGILLTNSLKGSEIVDKVKNNLLTFKEVPIDFAVKYSNPNLNGSFIENRNRSLFFKYREKFNHDYKKAFSYAIGDKYDIGLIFPLKSDIQGSLLSLYSINNILQKMDYRVLLLNCKNINNINQFSDFRQKYFNNSVLYTKQNLLNTNEICDKFIVAGNIWSINNIKINSDIIDLNFTLDNKTRIAYGTSFCEYNLSLEPVEKYALSYTFSRFDSLSVKENYGKYLLEEIGVKSEEVLDSIFLLEKQDYEKFIHKNDMNNKNYICSYLLNSEDWKVNIKNTIIKMTQLPNIQVNKNSSIEEFVSNIYNSSILITDSYYAICLAIIFNKNFIVVSHNNSTIANIESLLRKLGLTDRIIYSEAQFNSNSLILKDSINYNKVNEIISQNKINSLNYLTNALNIKKTIDTNCTQYDYLNLKRINNSEDLDRKQQYSHQKVLIYSFKYQLYRILFNLVPQGYKSKILEKKRKYKKLLTMDFK